MPRSQAQRIQQVARQTVRNLYRSIAPVESLETRRLMSVSYNAISDTVTITGTNGNDNYNVSQIVLFGAQTLRVTENGTNYDYNVIGSPVTRITGTLAGGDDTFTLQSTLG